MRSSFISVLSRTLAALSVTGVGACSPTAATTAPTQAAASVQATRAEPVQWADWSRATFDRAQRDDRLLLINVVAEWCHWCHVMEETTYADPEVAALLAEHFVTIRVDSDARPDVAERYRAWGWPATGILSPDAQPLVELRGFKTPTKFAALLRSLIADKNAGTLARVTPAKPQTSAAHADSALVDLASAATAQLDGFYDPNAGGWGRVQKYPFHGPLEHAMTRTSLRPHEDWRAAVALTLGGEAQLIDPVWGGMYQYSLRKVWTRPHYEKITRVQAGAIASFAMASRMLEDPQWLAGAYAVTEYMRETMRDDQGAFYTSQDADVRVGHEIAVEGIEYFALDNAQRRALGTPRVDDHVYADLNGFMILALTDLYRATADPAVLRDATQATAAILATHRTVSGGFVHDAADAPDGLLYLRDQATMGRALLGLYTVTGDRSYRDMAQATADYVLTHLSADSGGFYAQTVDPEAVGALASRRRPLEENALAARMLLDLDRLLDGDGTQSTHYAQAARAALRAVGGRDGVAERGRIIGEYVLALESAMMTTVDVTVVGTPKDPATQALLSAALAHFEPRAVVELSAPGERYPDTGSAAVFVCTTTACSSPTRDPAKVAGQIERFVSRNATPA